MKTIPPPCPHPETGPKYWRSLDELADKPEFKEWLHREFPAGASEFTDGQSRRHFMKIMSASFVLAGLGLSGCRRPEEKILPFSKMPENYTHGGAEYYATAMPVRGSAIPLVVKSVDGRPIKIEGNPQHPDSNGATDMYAQASILNLYDPDRAIYFRRGGNTITRDAAVDALTQIAQQAQAGGGRGLALLTEHTSSPSELRLLAALAAKYPQAKVYSYEPLDFDIHRQVAAAAFGAQVKPSFKLDEANVIVSLDCDFVSGEQDAHVNIRKFAKGRKIETPTGRLSRLYAVEGLFTLTGANADHRLRVPTSQVQAVAARLGAEILRQAGRAPLANTLQSLGQPAQAHEKWIVECAKDLLKPENAGRTVVMAGQRQPQAVHWIANAINAALNNIGTTVTLLPATPPPGGTIVELAAALNAGQVDTLVILGGNPVFNAPTELSWKVTQAKAKTVVRVGFYEDETSTVATVHLPQTHYLEAWGDARTSDGTYVSIQPLIAPLFNGISTLEVLARLAGETVTNPHEIARATYRQTIGGDEEAWKKFVHDGFAPGSAAQPVAAQLDWSRVATALGPARPFPALSKNALEVSFCRGLGMDDGRYNNNGWLMEMPDPITKLVWDNAILMSATTAADLGLTIKDNEDMALKVPVIRVKVGAKVVEGPAWIQPGMADHTLGLSLGHGRWKTGRIGEGVGYNAYAVRSSADAGFAVGATIESLGIVHPLSLTQNHWAMEGRPIIREANLEEFKKDEKFVKGMELPEPVTTAPLYPNPLDKLKATAIHQWGMGIDLNSCVGCGACVIACQSENNIPIVGKDQVRRNREMHWIRLDRYYAGPFDPRKSKEENMRAAVEDPQMVTMPMFCLHCEAAPCENVCPVNATTHDEEGLNLMVYNRCVGTRYCSNNCPYKVRRFNYLDFNRKAISQHYNSDFYMTRDKNWGVITWLKDVDKPWRPEDEWELLKLVKNPDVSVRMRGVMEKCTYCIQRIEGAKIAQKSKARASGDVKVPDNTFKTACEQACPAEAIVFGDISDPNSRVSKTKKLSRNYTVLDYLATKPRTSYLARVRNPNPALASLGYAQPYTTQEYHGMPEGSFHGHGGQGGAAGGHATQPAKGGH